MPNGPWQPPAGQPFGGPGCIGNMANLGARSCVPSAGTHPDGTDIEGLFRARYLEMVRLAGLLGADDPKDIAQEAFTRLMNKKPDLGDAQDAAGYLRAIVGNLTPNRHRHPPGVRRRTPSAATS